MESSDRRASRGCSDALWLHVILLAETGDCWTCLVKSDGGSRANAVCHTQRILNGMKGVYFEYLSGWWKITSCSWWGWPLLQQQWYHLYSIQWFLRRPTVICIWFSDLPPALPTLLQQQWYRLYSIQWFLHSPAVICIWYSDLPQALPALLQQQWYRLHSMQRFLQQWIRLSYAK